MKILIGLFKKVAKISLFLSMLLMLGCSSQESQTSETKGETIKEQQKDKNIGKPKPIVSSSKPKISKDLLTIDAIPKDKKFDEIKIIPIGDPERGLVHEKDEDEDKKESDDKFDE